MARADRSGEGDGGEPAPADEIGRQVHRLGNALHALTLRLFLLAKGELTAGIGTMPSKRSGWPRRARSCSSGSGSSSRIPGGRSGEA